MFIALMAVCAFVISVAGLAGLALLISRFSARAKGWDFRLNRITQHAAELTKTVNGSSGTKLRAELDDLRGALDVLRASHRREMGSLWARVGGKGNGKIIDNDTGVPLDGDDEVAAMIALQNARPARPESGE